MELKKQIAEDVSGVTDTLSLKRKRRKNRKDSNWLVQVFCRGTTTKHCSGCDVSSSRKSESGRNKT
jgi:hypothetical protein